MVASQSQHPPQQPLDEVMLAMDVVDTLRHRDSLVARELAVEDRDRELVERLREIYAAQGIEVPTRVLEAGVRARRENRFVYDPPHPSLSVTLAKLYIDRAKWGKRAGFTVLAFVVLVAAYVLLVAMPNERRANQDLVELTEALRTTQRQADGLEADVRRLRNAIAAASSSAPELVEESIAIEVQMATQALRDAAALLASARALPGPSNGDADSGKQSAHALAARVERKSELVSQAQSELEKASSAFAAVEALARLPARLNAEREAARSSAREAQAQAQAEQSYASALAALRAGDVSGARRALAALRSLREKLALRYTLQIVSRPSEYSGVWRIPDQNPNARNYYIIVEALAPDGERLTVPVVSEEDGKTYRVTTWGVRVEQGVFERIAADKQDDGIIQNRRFGVKRQGYLATEYRFATSGAAIVEW